jgi:hypothetical protein
MRPIHKLNGGIGATLCHICYVIISTGWTDDVICNTCKGYKDLGKFSKKEIRELSHKKDSDELLSKMIEQEAHKNNSNLNK